MNAKCVLSYSSVVAITEPKSPINLRSPVVDSMLTVRHPQKQDISSPLLYPTNFRNELNSLPGWTEKTALSFALISLEEAQAQHMRRTLPQVSISSGFNSVPFPKFTDKVALSHTPCNSVASSRHHSMSSSSKGKFAFPSKHPKQDRKISELVNRYPQTNGGMALRLRKSGFLRLFNSSRGKEEQHPMLLVAEPKLDQLALQGSASPHNPTPNPQAMFPLEVALPMMNQSLFLGTRKLIPPLPINTALYKNPCRPTFVITNGDCALTIPVWNHVPEACIQSAPANVSIFPPLQLCSSSALLTTEFADYIGVKESKPSLVNTPRLSSPPTVMFPLTPPSFSCFDSAKHSNNIKYFEDQIASAKSVWEQHIWALEGQLRDLKVKVEELRNEEDRKDYCEYCRQGSQFSHRNGDEKGQKICPASPAPTSLMIRLLECTADSSQFRSNHS